MTFIDFCQAHGIIVDRLPRFGVWARYKTEDKPHHKNGSVKFEGDFGFVQNHATMTNVNTWFEDKPMTPVDRAAQQARVEASRRAQAKERQRAQQSAASKAAMILRSSAYEQHAYLDGKGFPEKTGLVYRPDEQTNLLVIPMRVGSDLVGCQLIGIDGSKKFLFGQRCNGAEFVMGNDGIDIWLEGYATGLSVMAAVSVLKLKARVHVCFSANNLLNMARAEGRGVVIADHDASGVGEKAAIDTGLRYFLPPTEGTDFNDLHKDAGTFRASQLIRGFLIKK